MRKQIFRFLFAAGISLCLHHCAMAQNQTSDNGLPHTVEQWKGFIKEVYFDKYYDFGIASNGEWVFIKYYKNWQPKDLKTLKENASKAFQFLAECSSSQHFPGKGHQALEELLPDYYKTHGGVDAFRRDILAVK